MLLRTAVHFLRSRLWWMCGATSPVNTYMYARIDGN